MNSNCELEERLKRRRRKKSAERGL